MAKVIEVTACQTCPYKTQYNKCGHPSAYEHRDEHKLLPTEGIADFCCLPDKDDYVESEFDIDRDFDENSKDGGKMPPPFHYNNVAEDEGWGIFYTALNDDTHNLYELQRFDDIGNFKDDHEAKEYVVDQAMEKPKSHYAEALLWLARYCPDEIDDIKLLIGQEKFAKLKEVMRYTEFDKIQF